MPKLDLTPKRVLQFIIFGIQNGNYQAAIDLCQDCIDQLPEDIALDPEIHCSCGGKWRTDGQHQNKFCDKCYKPHRKEIIMAEEKLDKGEERLYIGAKLIRAILMTEFKFKGSQGQAIVGDDRLGYQVKYPDGYISWSPKDVFETAYREVTAGERELF